MDHLPHARLWAEGGHDPGRNGDEKIEKKDDQDRVTKAEIVCQRTEHSKCDTASGIWESQHAHTFNVMSGLMLPYVR